MVWIMKPKRPVVSVDTDGSIHGYFESRTEAEKLSGICHKDMGRALKNHYYSCRGFKWYYENEYREGWFRFGEEHFAWEPSVTHKRFGTGFKKGHTLGNGYQYWTEETRRKRSEASRRLCYLRKERGGYASMAKKLMKPVVCVTDGMVFESVKACAKHYGIPSNYISASIIRNGTTKGLKFRFNDLQTDHIRETPVQVKLLQDSNALRAWQPCQAEGIEGV